MAYQIQLRGSRTRALGTLFHKMNNDLMTINGFEPSRRVSSLLKGLFRRQGQFCFISQKKTFLIGIAPPPPPPLTVSRIYLSYCAIWLLQNFSPTTYRPPLPSRLLTRYSKPSKFTTNKILLLVSEI